MSQSIEPSNIMRKAFPGIPRREADELVALGKMQTHDAGVILCREDVIEDTFYIILDGDVEVTKVVAFEDAMQSHLKSNNQDLLDMINETGDYNDDIKAKMIAALDNFKQTGTY